MAKTEPPDLNKVYSKKELKKLCSYSPGVCLRARFALEYGNPKTTEELVRYTANLVRYYIYEKHEEYFDTLKKVDNKNRRNLLELVIYYILNKEGECTDFEKLCKRVSKSDWEIHYPYELSIDLGGNELKNEIRSILNGNDELRSSNETLIAAANSTVHENELRDIYKTTIPAIYACTRFALEFGKPENPDVLTRYTSALIRYCAKTNFNIESTKEYFPLGTFSRLAEENSRRGNNFLEKIVYFMLTNGGITIDFDNITKRLNSYKSQYLYLSFRDEIVPHIGGEKLKAKICHLIKTYKKK